MKNIYDISPTGIYKNKEFIQPLEYGIEIKLLNTGYDAEVNFDKELYIEYTKNELKGSITFVFKVRKPKD